MLNTSASLTFERSFGFPYISEVCMLNGEENNLVNFGIMLG